MMRMVDGAVDKSKLQNTPPGFNNS